MTMRGVNGYLTVLVAALVLSGFGGTAAMAAVDIGVTSAVRPDATGTPPQGDSRILYVGLDVSANERIETGPSGQTHLLFRDGSALTIGPNASMVLDTFVYDTDRKEGELVVSVSKGLFRFVGGRLSKKKPVLFKTPTAVIGIRGGVAMMDIGGGGSSTVTMLFGDEVFMDNGQARQTMNRPGFAITQTSGGGINPPVQATDQDLAGNLNRLEDPQGDNDESDGVGLGNIAPAAGGPAVNDQDVSDSQISELGSSNAPTELAPDDPGAALALGDAGGNGTVDGDLAEASQREALDSESEGDADSGGDDTVSGDSGIADSSAGGSAGSTSSAGSSTSASTGITLASVGGRGRCCESNATGTDDSLAARNFTLTDASVVDGVLTATGGSGTFTLSFPGAGETTLTASDDSGTVFDQFADVQAGSVYVSSAEDFAVYELRSDADGSMRGLIVAGQPTSAANFPTSGFTSYTVLDDFTLADAPVATAVPFVDNIYDSGITADGSRAYIAWDNAESGSHRAFALGRVVIYGSAGSAQESGASVIAGSVLTGGSGNPYIAALMRGSSHEGSAFKGTFQFHGQATSLPTAGGEHFYGAAGPENFLLGGGSPNGGGEPTFDAVNYETGGQTAMTELYPNTIGVSGSHASSSPNGTRTTQTLRGYAGGLFIQHTGGSTAIGGTDRLVTETIGSTAPGLVINTNDMLSRVDVALNGYDDNGDSFQLNFGSLTSANANSAFIDDKIFVAIEDTAGRGDFGGEAISSGTGYFTTAHNLQTSGLIPSGVSLCSCEYLTWGFLGFDVNNSAAERKDAGHLVTWIAGSPVTDTGRFPMGVSATYQGHVWGTVYNGTDTYQAVGSLTMSVSGVGNGVVNVDSGTIANFDGGSYSLTDGTGGLEVVPAGIFHANATLTARNGYAAGDIQGRVTGNFFGPGSMPENLGGNFWLNKVQGNGATYQAGGTAMAAKSAQTMGGN